MKQRIHLLIPLLASSMLAVTVCKGTVVFSDDFSETPGTPIIGKSPDVGSAWTGTDNGTVVSAANSLDTTGAGRTLFGAFTASLGAGEVLTLSYDTLALGGTNFFVGWAGVSLYAGGGERAFTGSPGLPSWGVDGTIPAGQQGSGDTTAVTSATFTYAYDTGAWSFTTLSGSNLFGVGASGVALDQLRVANGAGADINLDNLVVDISAASVFSFTSETPADGSYSASVTNPIRVLAVDGSFPVDTNTIVMKVDAGTVTPDITKTNNVTTISYVPVSPLSAGSLHTVLVTLADTGGTSHTNTWSFTTGYPALPVAVAGPFAVSNAVDLTLFTADGDPWLSTNYQGGLTETLYVRFSAQFVRSNATGLTWGGLQFYQDDTERVLTGKAGPLDYWSVAAAVPDTEIPPVTAFTTNEWHTFVVRTDFSAGEPNAAVKVWLDPDFGQTEANQPYLPLELSVDNTFNNIRLRAGFTPAVAEFSNIVVAATSDGVGFVAPAEPTFQNYVPANNAPAASLSTPIGVDILFGTYGISTNDITVLLDGNPVTPGFTVTSNSITVNYQPGSPWTPGSVHWVDVSLTDANNAYYWTSWSFTVDPYPTLPVTFTGPIDAFAGGPGTTILSSQNGCIGAKYGDSSTNTLYTRFSMSFYDLNNETGTGGGFGGLHFFNGGSEHLIVGNNWPSTNWSFDAVGSAAGGQDLVPAVPIVLLEWHTLVIKQVFNSNADDDVSIWFDPDFSMSEFNQPVAATTFSMNNSFDSIHLRAGNGSAYASFTNIVMAATAAEVGFAPGVPPAVLSILGAQLSWTSSGVLEQAPTVLGPWTDASNQANPQTIMMTNAAQYYRLRQ